MSSRDFEWWYRELCTTKFDPVYAGYKYRIPVPPVPVPTGSGSNGSYGCSGSTVPVRNRPVNRDPVRFLGFLIQFLDQFASTLGTLLHGLDCLSTTYVLSLSSEPISLAFFEHLQLKFKNKPLFYTFFSDNEIC